MCRPGEQAAKAFSELAAVLGQAPDPQPFLDAIGPLQERISELQRENRRLQLHQQAAESEASSASQAVLRSRELERENAELKAQLNKKARYMALSRAQDTPRVCPAISSCSISALHGPTKAFFQHRHVGTHGTGEPA